MATGDAAQPDIAPTRPMMASTTVMTWQVDAEVCVPSKIRQWLASRRFSTVRDPAFESIDLTHRDLGRLAQSGSVRA